MKKSFSILVVLLYALSINAQVVTMDEARQVAKNLLFEKSGKQQLNITISNEYILKENETVLYYVFNFGSNNGFAIISGDARTYPVLGYSTTGYYSATNNSPALDEWLKMYSLEIKYAKAKRIKQANKVKDQWNKYNCSIDKFVPVKGSRNIVGPLFNTGGGDSIAYNQDPYYNDKCPNNALVGCVATAMSQVMVFYDHPERGIGYREYNHAKPTYQNDFGVLSADFSSTYYNTSTLPNSITGTNDDVALLCYHAGVSVLMNYSVDGSSSSTLDAAHALITNWDFDKGIKYLRKSSYTDLEWQALLRSDLDAGLPIIYRGSDVTAGGHAWICDGYDDTDNTFHMNWGWGGSSNGFYTLSSLPNDGTVNFTDENEAIFGIKPNYSSTKYVVMENFEDYYLSPEWNQNADNDDASFWMFSDGYNSNGCIGNDGQVNQWLVSPKIGLPDNSTITFSAYSKRLNDYNQAFEVYISTSGADILTDFNKVGSYTITDDWTNLTLDLTAYRGLKVYLGIKVTGTESFGSSIVYLDDIEITATPLVAYTISGNAGIADAKIYYTDGILKTVTTDVLGDYYIEVPSNWSGTITPLILGSTFNPTERSYFEIQADQPNQNFTSTTCSTVPFAFDLSGKTSYCANTDGVTLTLSGSQSTATYYLYDGLNFNYENAGDGNEIGWIGVKEGTYSVVAEDNVGCTAMMNNTITVTVDAVPVVFNLIDATPNFCENEVGGSMLLSGTELGIEYSWVADGTKNTYTGDGQDVLIIDLPEGTYTVLATNLTNTCSVEMNGMVTIKKVPLPKIYDFVANNTSYCKGNPGVPLTLINSQVGVNYQLIKDGASEGDPVSGTDTSLTFENKQVGTYSVVALTSFGCIADMNGTLTITETIEPTNYILTTNITSYCEGGLGAILTLSGSEVGINYQLFKNNVADGSIITGTGSQLKFTGKFAGVYTIIAAGILPSCIGTMTGNIAIVENKRPTPFDVTGSGSYFSSTTGLTISLSDSQTDVNYQLKNNSIDDGVPKLGTGSALTWIDKLKGMYSIVATNANTQCSQTMTGTAVITEELVPQAFNLTSVNTAICIGGIGVISLNSSQLGVNYQLKQDDKIMGIALAGTGNIIEWTINQIGTYTVEAKNTTNGSTKTMNGNVVITAAPSQQAFELSGTGAYCKLSDSVFVKLADSETGVKYYLRKDGINTGSAVSGTGEALKWKVSDYVKFTVVASGTLCAATMTNAATISQKTGTKPELIHKFKDVSKFDLLIVDNSNKKFAKYQWYHDNVKFDTLQYLAIRQPGKYNVIVTDSAGCTSYSDTVTISPQKYISVYPNPSAGIFKFELNNPQIGKMNVRLLNTVGIQIQRFEFEKTEALFIGDINVAGYLPGVYTLEIEVAGDIQYQKIVVESR